MLKLCWWIILALSMFQMCLSDHGQCDSYTYRRGTRTCQAVLFEKIGNSSNSLSNCLSTLYPEAVRCFNSTVIQQCYKHLDGSMLKMVEERELETFGGEDFYCEYGGIPSIKPIIEAIIVNETKCKINVSMEIVGNCENKFYEEFRDNPSSAKLCSLAFTTQQCQMLILSYCNLAYSVAYGRGGFAAISTAANENVHCDLVKDILGRPNATDPNASPPHHSTSWDVIVPVIIIGVIILLALTVGFCHFAKKEARKNKEEKRKNKRKIAQRLSEQKKSIEEVDQRHKEDEELLAEPGTQKTEDVSTV